MTYAMMLMVVLGATGADVCEWDMDCSSELSCIRGRCIDPSTISARDTHRATDLLPPAPLSGGRLLGELFLGSLLAVGAAAIPTVLIMGNAFACSDGGDCGGGGLAMLALISLPFVYPLGAAAGVYAVGSSGNESASFGATYGGALLGVLGGILIGVAAGNADSAALGIAALAAPVFGAMIGFNQTRGVESHAVSIAPVPMSDGMGFGLTMRI